MNIKDKAATLTDYFSPKIIGEVNDVFVKVAKIKGDKIPWHTHEEEDELFYVIEGSLYFEIENADPFHLRKGELFIVPKGIQHKISSDEECLILLVENKTTKHTGTIKTAITKSIEDQF